MLGQTVRIGTLKTGGQFKRSLANPVCKLGLLAIVGLALISFVALGGPEDIGTETHAGEMAIDGVGTGSWSTGNITQYREGDQIRFRFEVDSTSELAKSGKLNIAFSLEDAVCHFFDGSLELGAVETLEGPAVWAVTKIGTAVVVGNEWIQTIQIDKAAGTSPTGLFIGRVNYTLKLETNIGVCGGSSQHSRLENHPTDPGDVVSDGLKNVPVPGNQIILFPDITVTKYVDRDNDGTFETTASAGEFSFTLDGSTTLLTDSSGTVFFEQVQPDGDHTVTEQQVDFSNGTYHFDHGDGINTTFAGSTATATVYAGTSLAVQHAQVNFYNTASNPALSIDKSAGSYVDSNGSGSPDAGESLTYSYVVTNVGNVTLTGIVVSDDKLGTITMSAITLDPGQQATGQKSHTFTQAEIDNGSVTNIATADSNETPPSTDTVTLELTADPAITLTKTGTLDMTVVAPVDRADVGDTVTYAFTVTNTGNVTLTNVSVSDPQITVLGDPIASLAPGASDSTTFTGTYTLTQSDVDAGTFVNTATATGTPPTGPNVTGDGDDTQTLTADPAIALIKTGTLDIGVDGVATVGDLITYAFTVTNTGNVTLTNITVTDPKVTVTGGPLATLAPGASDSTTFTATYALIQADIDAGMVENQALATGTPPVGDPVTDLSDDNSNFENDTTVVYIPSIALIKTGTLDIGVDGVATVGDLITYAFTVTNTGDVTLTNITVTDPKVTVTGGPLATLAPGTSDSTTFTATYALIQADIDAGMVENQALATGTPPVGDPVTDLSDDNSNFENDTTVVYIPSIALIKTGTLDIGVDGVATVGDLITYAFTVTNTGDVTLTNITVTDPKVTVTGGPLATLAPGASDSTTFTATYALIQADIDAGMVENQALATGTPPVGDPVTDLSDDNSNFENDTTVVYIPSIALIKTGTLDIGVDGVATVGDLITYAFTVTNTGDVTLTNITVTDPKVTVTGGPLATLAPGTSDSTTFTATYALIQADIDAGMVENQALATGTPPVGDPVTDLSDDNSNFENDTTVVYIPSIALIKTGTLDIGVDGVATVGDLITYAFTVTNTGDVTLTNITVTDPKVTVTGGPLATLAPGTSDSTTFTATYALIQADIDAGMVENQALATGTPPVGDPVTDLSDDNSNFENDTTVVYIPQAPSLTIDKSGDEGPVRVGETINYQITVTNTGNIMLHNVTITDPMLGITQNLGTFAPGDSQVIPRTYGPVTEDDLPGPLVNTAIADSDETDPVEDDHSVEILPVGIDLSLTKTIDDISPEVGELVTIEILLTNDPSFADATNVEVTDTLPAGYAFVDFTVSQGTYTYTGLDSLWIVGDLPAGSSATLQVFATVLEDGPYESPAEVTAADQDDIDSIPSNASMLSEDDDDRTVIFIDTPIADLLVTKTVDNANSNEEEIVVFTVSVYNGGPYISTGIVLQDALPTGLTYVSDTSNGAYNPATNAWDVGSLIVGKSASFTLSAQVDVGTAGTTLTNTALIIQNEIEDPSPANNQDSASVTISAPGVCKGKIIISEIAWAGTAANPEDEWIELRNIGGEPVDLTGWVLRWRKKQPVTTEDLQWKTVELFGELQASSTPICELTDREPEPAVDFVKREVDDLSWFVVARPVDFDESYMIMERRSDLTISNVDADIVYDDVEPYLMKFSDDGDIIELLDVNGEIVDTANAFPSYDNNWPAGDILTKGTMERIDPLGPDERDNWHTNLGIITRGLDANGRPLVASADVVNSQTPEEMRLFADLNPTITLPGARLEVGLDLPRDSRRGTGWPWIRITRPDVTASPDTGDGSIEPVYSFTSRYTNDTYWLGIDTAGLVPGDYLIWIIYGEGQTVLIPITILD